MKPRISDLFIKEEHGAPMSPRAEVEAVEAQGLAGDAAFGTTRRQLLIIDAETLRHFDLEPGLVRENVTVEGLSLRGVPAGARLVIGEVVLEITGDCTPCRLLDELRPGLQQALVGRRGLLARVLRGGRLRLGQPVALEDAPLSVGAG